MDPPAYALGAVVVLAAVLVVAVYLSDDARPCKTDADCAGKADGDVKPYCATFETKKSSGVSSSVTRCVACRDLRDCPSEKPICYSGTCEAPCKSDTDCKAYPDRPKCSDGSVKTCEQCLKNEHCRAKPLGLCWENTCSYLQEKCPDGKTKCAASERCADDNSCIKLCKDASECGSGKTCSGGFCTDGSTRRVDSDAPR